MDARSIPPHLDSRLSRLNDEIRDGLTRIRGQLHQLQEAEQRAAQVPSTGASSFAAALKSALTPSGSVPASTEPRQRGQAATEATESGQPATPA